MGSDNHPSDEENGFKLFGIEWAPLNVPLERRMQTLTVFLWFFSVVFGFWVNVAFMYLVFLTPVWPIVILYLGWMYYDRNTAFKGGRRYKLFRRLRIWNHFRDYFPISLVKTADLPPTRNYLFCVFPHGFLASGALLNFGTDVNNFYKLYPGLEPHMLTLSLNFKLPFLRDTILALGCCSVARNSMVNLLNKEPCGEVAVLVVGGAAESLKAEPGTYRIVIKNRKGFVKLALETGTDLVPVISFGENDMYGQYKNPILEKFQNFFRSILGFAPLVPRGRGFFQYTVGIIPHRRPVNTVVGKAILLPKIEKPTEEDINTYHQKFMNELQTLFNEYKTEYDPNGAEAELIME